MKDGKIKCPACESGYVKMIDHQPLALLPEYGQYDPTLYATMDCIKCGNQFSMEFEVVHDLTSIGKGKKWTLQDGDRIKFKLKTGYHSVPPEFVDEMVARDGMEATIQCPVTHTEVGVREFEYYDIIFDDGYTASAVSGYHLIDIP